MSEGQPIPPQPLLIREPRESEFAAIRMLLPETAADPAGRAFRLAFDPNDGSIAGALSWRDEGVSLSGLRIHVVAQRRRSGIGSRLLEHTIAEARDLGRDQLIADADLLREPAAEPFLSAREFRKTGSLTTAEGESRRIKGAFMALISRLPPTGRLPENASVIPLSDAPQDQVARLYAAYIAHVPDMAGISRVVPFDQFSESIVLLVDGQVEGMVLGELRDGVMHIPAWVVTEAHRGKLTGTALLLEFAKRFHERVERTRFEFAESAGRTAKLVTELGCAIIRVVARFERTLSALPGA